LDKDGNEVSMSEDDYNSEDYGEEGEADLFDYVKGGELTAE